MSADVEVTHDKTRAVAHVEGMSEEGIEFVDAYFPKGAYEVLDAGRIVIASAEVEEFATDAKVRGVSVEVVGTVEKLR